MTPREVAKLVASLAVAAAGGWIAALIWLWSKPQPWPKPLHLLDQETP